MVLMVLMRRWVRPSTIVAVPSQLLPTNMTSRVSSDVAGRTVEAATAVRVSDSGKAMGSAPAGTTDKAAAPADRVAASTAARATAAVRRIGLLPGVDGYGTPTPRPRSGYGRDGPLGCPEPRDRRQRRRGWLVWLAPKRGVPMPQRLHLLEHLSAALGDAVTVDDVARAALTEMLEVEGVVRAGVAVSHGAGRELSFASTDQDALGPTWVRWCAIDGLADVPLAQSVRTSIPVYLATLEDLEREFPGIAPRQGRLGTHAMASVPMTVEGTCVGALMLSYG